MQGIHFSVGLEDSCSVERPVLEERAFIPNFDSNILTQEEKTQLEDYSSVCSTLAHRIWKASHCRQDIGRYKEATEKEITRFLSMEEKNHSLLKVLNEVLHSQPSSDMKENFKHFYDQNEAELHMDILETVSLKKRSLGALLEIVHENQHSNKLNILEVSESTSCSKTIIKMLNLATHGQTNVDYTIARLNEHHLPDNILYEKANLVLCNLSNDTLPGENDLVLAKDVLTQGSLSPSLALNHLAEAVKNYGFVLLMERTCFSASEKLVSLLRGNSRKEIKVSELEAHLAQCGLSLIAKKDNGFNSVLYLLRKVPSHTQVVTPEMFFLTDDFSWVESLRNKLKDTTKNDTIWLTSESPVKSDVLGIVGYLRSEPGGHRLRCLFNATSQLKYHSGDSLLKDVFRNNLVYNVLQNGQCGMFRQQSIPYEQEHTPCRDSHLSVLEKGDISSLRWIQSSPPRFERVEKDLTKVQIYYAPLNRKDLIFVTGELPSDRIPNGSAANNQILGTEFVGREMSGRRVMGFLPCGGLSTSVLIPSSNLIELPNHWSMEEASSIPIAYATAYYALVVRGVLTKGESVLIHSGAGDIGQAAISIALSMDCEVFTTVGSDDEKQFLQRSFPALKDNHVSSSQDLFFEFDILNVTSGQGVDLVLNSLPADKLRASLRCVKTNGKFLHLGEIDMATNKELKMSVFLKNMTFHGVVLDKITSGGNYELQKQLINLIKDGIKAGVVRPLSRYVFPATQVTEAFKYLASDKSMGKVVIKLRQEEATGKPDFESLLLPSLSFTHFKPEKSYVITDGLGCFGFELARWLVSRGAKKLILCSQFPIKDEYQKLCIQKWKEQGITVAIEQLQINTMESLKKLLSKANSVAPVGGIFYLEMISSEKEHGKQSAQQMEKSSFQQAESVRHLDELTRKTCAILDHFVVFSTITSSKGIPVPSLSKFNSVVERTVLNRRQQALPGLIIQWGNIDCGFKTESKTQVTIPQKIRSCLEVIDRVMQESRPIVSSYVPDRSP